MRTENASIFSNTRTVVLGALAFTVFSLTLIRTLGLDTLGKTLETHMQFLDIPLLREAPWQSILYTHSQPPLLNVITWILSLLPTDLYLNFIVLNTLCGYLTGLVIYDCEGVVCHCNVLGVTCGISVYNIPLLSVSHCDWLCWSCIRIFYCFTASKYVAQPDRCLNRLFVSSP